MNLPGSNVISARFAMGTNQLVQDRHAHLNGAKDEIGNEVVRGAKNVAPDRVDSLGINKPNLTSLSSGAMFLGALTPSGGLSASHWPHNH